MNNTYFIIDDIKYIIAYDNNQLKIKKMENNLLYELTETEKGEINRLISHKTGYIYYSEKVINIVNNVFKTKSISSLNGISGSFIYKYAYENKTYNHIILLL